MITETVVIRKNKKVWQLICPNYYSPPQLHLHQQMSPGGHFSIPSLSLPHFAGKLFVFFSTILHFNVQFSLPCESEALESAEQH